MTESELAEATRALVARYRSVRPADAPILWTTSQVAAYAAYRMPATHAALVKVLGDAAFDGFSPRTMLDLGGGTGAAAWAAAERFDDLEKITVLDHIDEVLRLGRSLVARIPDPVLADAAFERADIAAPAEGLAGIGADLVTISYVLSELTPASQRALVARARLLGRLVVVVEPGTPDGYARVLAVRRRFIEAGWPLVGPCPHAAECLLHEGDWCHFVGRVNRSAEHRRIKGGELSYEDEKFSWVAATAPSGLEQHTASGRICQPDGTAGREVVSKRAGARYRAARDAEWGDQMP